MSKASGRERGPVAIVGGGLTGLYAAWLLTQAGVDFELLEAQDRLGGRILTERPGAGTARGAGAFDLGPTWYWPAMQSRMPDLVQRLGLRAFEQPGDGATLVELSPTDRRRVAYGSAAGAMRLAGGMGSLIEALAARLEGSRVHTGSPVLAMRHVASGEVELELGPTPDSRLHTRFGLVLSTLPPRVLAQRVRMEPSPAKSVIESWRAVPTWMAPHAKVVAVYPRPFWRDDGLSGQAQSRVGPLTEIHDASAPDGPAALFGFVGVPAGVRRQAGRPQIQTAAVAQLQRLFGDEAAHPLDVYYKDWAIDVNTATDADASPPDTHPSYGQQAAPGEPWRGALVLAGSETAVQQGGYLEGALESAEAAVRQILALWMSGT